MPDQTATEPMTSTTSADNLPAIQVVNYMGDADDMRATNVIGPYPDVASRDADLARILALPLGAPEYRGGYRFGPATMVQVAAAKARGEWFVTVVAPARVAKVTTLEEFADAYWALSSADAL